MPEPENILGGGGGKKLAEGKSVSLFPTLLLLFKTLDVLGLASELFKRFTSDYLGTWPHWYGFTNKNAPEAV